MTQTQSLTAPRPHPPSVTDSVRALTRRIEGRQVVKLLAAPGWGKSTFAAAWGQEVGGHVVSLWPEHADVTAFLTALADAGITRAPVPPTTQDPETIAAQIIDSGSLPHGWLVLDDVHHLSGSAAQQVLAHLVRRLPAATSMFLTARTPVDLLDSDVRASGQLLELGAPQLRLNTAQISEWLAQELDENNPALAARLAGVTAGWPALVHLLIEALHDVPAEQRPAAVQDLAGPGGPVGQYLQTGVLQRAPGQTRRLLMQIALAEPISSRRLASATGKSTSIAAQALTTMAKHGLIVPDNDAGHYTLPPALAEAVLDHGLPDTREAQNLTTDVVAALLDEGRGATALTVLARTDQTGHIAALLEHLGAELIRQGALGAVCQAAALVPADLRTPTIERVHALALTYRGEWAAALRHLGAAGDDDADRHLPATLALTLGLVHHFRGDLEKAISAYSRGIEDAREPAWGELLAWNSTAHWLRGDISRASQLADEVMNGPAQLADHVLSLAHTAQALVAVARGDRRANRTHYEQALEAATRAGDQLQRARVLNNLGSHYLENAEYAAALTYTDEAIELAETQGYALIAGVARSNRAEIRSHTGAIEEAIVDAEVARDVFARIGSRLEAYAHSTLGDLRREQGDLAQAERAYTHALQLTEPSGDQQGNVPAFIGLARTLASSDPEAALQAAERAQEADRGMMVAESLLAVAWSHLAAGETEKARQRAVEAEREAVRRGSRAALAEATTLQAVLGDDPVSGLQDAASIWQSVGMPISAARVELGIARRGSDPDAPHRATIAERRLQALGCSPAGGAFAHRVISGVLDTPKVTIRALGVLAVERAGRPLPRSAWGSRKARELLKFLVVHRERTITREELAEHLWPGEAYQEVSNRLSIALSVARSALVGDGDAKSSAPLVVDGDRVGLDLSRVNLDVEDFQRTAERGLDAARRGDLEGAQQALDLAEEVYIGDLYEDDRDAVWFADHREELHSMYLSVTRTLADLVSAENPDHALRLWLRVLDRDPYDESVHHQVCRALVRSGRHGEARRRHRLYARMMAELDLPAVPLAAITED